MQLTITLIRSSSNFSIGKPYQDNRSDLCIGWHLPLLSGFGSLRKKKINLVSANTRQGFVFPVFLLSLFPITKFFGAISDILEASCFFQDKIYWLALENMILHCRIRKWRRINVLRYIGVGFFVHT